MMIKNSYASWRLLVSTALVCTVMTFSTPVLAAKQKLPEVSSDGLHLVPKSKVRIAYMKPGVSLEKYDQVKILDCYVEFAKDWQRDYNMDEIGINGRVTNKDVQEISQRLSAEFNKEFTKVLEKKGYPVVDNVGPDVLLLRPALLNVEVTAPDLMTPGMSTELVRSAGSMTLYMELYDSATSELIGRIVDPEQDLGMGEVANRATNTAAADRIISRWASLLAEHLAEVAKPAKKKKW
jgi:hypothetical protein